MSTVIEAQELFRVYATLEGKAAALQGLSLEVEAGETVVVFGPSGSGKTTLLRTVAALDAPSAGSVRVAGVDLRRLGGRARDRFRAQTIGYVDQHYSRVLAPELTARQLVELPLALRGEPAGSRRRRADELLERVGLESRADARPAELSGGEQQRVALCAALVHRPAVLLADEPTGELDAATAEKTYTLISELVGEERVTALIVSHDVGSARIADRIVQIRDGRVSAEARSGADEALVVGSTGWVRIPEELLVRSGIGERARPALAPGGVTLSPAGQPIDVATDGPRLPRTDRTRPSGVAAEVRDVERAYPTATTLRRMSARFAAGRVTAVVGPSGSGKTTLLHLLAGLDLPTNGEVVTLGRPMSRLDRAARAELRRVYLGVVAQDAPLVPFLSARANVELASQLRAAHEDGLGALAAVGLEELADQRVDELSMGERQRVAIARAIGARPELVLADEPTARLDEANALAVSRLLAGLVEEWETTVIFSTHDPMLLEVADEVVEL
jgi:ABC-type lipoprotein export system ATPase subunit